VTDRDHPHGHGHVAADNRRRLTVALVVVVLFMGFEVLAALVSHSLALLADAGHMLTDAGAIGLSLTAARLAARPATSTMTYGYKRAEILAATGNGLTLAVVSVLVLVEAVHRLVTPTTVHGGVVAGVALIGAAVNGVATFTLSRADRRSLNVQAVFQHLLTDLYAFGATVVAGVVIATTGFERADSIASLVVVVLMATAAVGLLRPALRILAEAAPGHVDLADVRHHLLELPEVLSVHDLHAWTLTSGLPVLTAHVVVTDECLNTGEVGRVLDHLQDCLAGHFDVEHSTFQLEAAGHADHEFEAHD